MVRRLPVYATSAVAAVFLVIGGVTAGGAQAIPSENVLPLTPMAQQPLTPASQQSAVRAAKNYLNVMGMSRTGLINQLVSFDSFSAEDAAFAVDSLTVDWNQQAARSAQNYLNVMGMSRSGLTNQLTSFDGYTYAQAVYGVTAVGL